MRTREACFVVIGFALMMFASSGCQTATPQQPQNPTRHAERCPVALIDAADTPYGQALIKAISSAVFYPKPALEYGQSGEVILCVQTTRDGYVMRALIDHSSGYSLLDGAALYAAGQASDEGDIANLPAAIISQARDAWFSVPVRFTDIDPQLEPKVPSPCTEVAPDTVYQKMQSLVQKYIIYPTPAFRNLDEGSAVIRFAIDRRSEFSQVRIMKSAGNPLFDGDALMIIGAIGLSQDRPCFSTSAAGISKELFVEIPINWELK